MTLLSTVTVQVGPDQCLHYGHQNQEDIWQAYHLHKGLTHNTWALTSTVRSDIRVCHPTLIQNDSTILETIQRHALKLIYRNNDDKSLYLSTSGLPKLSERRNNMCQNLFFEM